MVALRLIQKGGCPKGISFSSFFGKLSPWKIWEPRTSSSEIFILYALDRFESRDKIINLLDAGHIVICDRYSFSNIAHQSARAPQNEKKSMAEWVSKVEHEILGLPTADLILFLDSTTEWSQELVSKKDKRIYTDKTHDIQESSNEHLSEALIQFRALAEKEDWTVIPCLNSSNAMRSISDIHQEIFKYVTDFIKHR
ncbi:dTMP kinase [Aeromonas molluscorum]|uniref:dTMP kinase n=1 Tax=Aeromonas molluscorum TaxID=271417 RepID=UPI003F1B9D7F